jgi:uncharacterized protein
MSSARIDSEFGEGGAYVDTSALAKLVLDESESLAMEEVFKRTPLTSSALLVTELLRTVRRDFPERSDHAIALLDHIDTMPIDPDVLMLAGFVGAPGLRALDAIHLVTAAMLYPEVSPLITYDRRLAAAAKAFGLQVASPR